MENTKDGYLEDLMNIHPEIKRDDKTIGVIESHFENKSIIVEEKEFMPMLGVRFKRLHPAAQLPEYAKPGDAGMDLMAVGYEYDRHADYYVYHTGLAVEIPKGYVGLLFPRSSNRKTDAYLTNHVGVIDSGYRGEILACFKNRDSWSVLNECGFNHDIPYNIGDKIVQLIIMPYPKIHPIWADNLTETERGDQGYGSTGN
jgi:dUTP pyrophosphatase